MTVLGRSALSTIQPVLLAADHDVLLGFSAGLFGAEEIFRVPAEGPVFYPDLRIGDTGLGLMAKSAPGGREASRILLSIGADDTDGSLGRVRRRAAPTAAAPTTCRGDGASPASSTPAAVR